MEIKIKDLKPNPYRDMRNYPINREKVETLKTSILQTSFWDNIVVRKRKNGTYQIAYGHHRLIAVQELFNPDDIVDLPVRGLTDAIMIQMMASENMDEWKASIAVIDETVKAAKKFLEQHPEEIKKMGLRPSPEGRIGSIPVSKFLGWKEGRIYDSLDRLKLIDKGILDATAVKAMPSERHAREFTTTVKKKAKTSVPVSKPMQRKIANKITEKKPSREIAQEVEDAVVAERFPERPRPKQVTEEEKRVKEFESGVASGRNTAVELSDFLRKINSDITKIGPEPFMQSKQMFLLLITLRDLKVQMDKLITKTEKDA